MAGRVVAVGVRKPVVAVQIERRHLGAIVEAAASERERTDMHPCIPKLFFSYIFSSRGRIPPAIPLKRNGVHLLRGRDA